MAKEWNENQLRAAEAILKHRTDDVPSGYDFQATRAELIDDPLGDSFISKMAIFLKKNNWQIITEEDELRAAGEAEQAGQAKQPKQATPSTPTPPVEKPFTTVKTPPKAAVPLVFTLDERKIILDPLVMLKVYLIYLDLQEKFDISSEFSEVLYEMARVYRSLTETLLLQSEQAPSDNGDGETQEEAQESPDEVPWAIA